MIKREGKLWLQIFFSFIFLPFYSFSWSFMKFPILLDSSANTGPRGYRLNGRVGMRGDLVRTDQNLYVSKTCQVLYGISRYNAVGMPRQVCDFFKWKGWGRGMEVWYFSVKGRGVSVCEILIQKYGMNHLSFSHLSVRLSIHLSVRPSVA